MTHDLNPAHIEVVSVKRSEGEVPHDLGGGLRIVFIDERKGQSGDVILELAVRGKGDLRRVLFGGGLIRRWPIQVVSRNYLHLHALFDEDEVSGTYQPLDHRRVVGSNNVSGLHLSTSRDDSRNNCNHQRESSDCNKPTESHMQVLEKLLETFDCCDFLDDGK